MNYQQAYEKLNKINQTHLLKFYDELNEEEKNILLNKIEKTDFSVLSIPEIKKEREVISPIKTLALEEIKKEEEEDRLLGIKALKENKVACLLLAGGMGSRLGFDKPKGLYNMGLTKELSIFECQMNTLKEVVKECGNYIYLFIMTSPLNDEDTRNFFKENNYFGYDKEYIKFFIQDEFPVTDEEEKVLLDNKYTPSTAANGNGGWFLSLKNAKLDEFALSKGIEYFNVYAVDNVLQKMADPLFIGATLKRKAEVGAKVVRKVDVNEKVGVICLSNGHPSITEYIDLTDELRYSKDEEGEYLYNFGVILNYLFKFEALERTTSTSLQIYKAKKKYAYMNLEGEYITPDSPNAYKRETLVLDMIKMMDSCLSFEVEREKEFAPVKNLHGVDSVDSARGLLIKNNVKL